MDPRARLQSGTWSHCSEMTVSKMGCCPCLNYFTRFRNKTKTREGATVPFLALSRNCFLTRLDQLDTGESTASIKYGNSLNRRTSRSGRYPRFHDPDMTDLSSRSIEKLRLSSRYYIRLHEDHIVSYAGSDITSHTWTTGVISLKLGSKS
jgi:hypothetical protein